MPTPLQPRMRTREAVCGYPCPGVPNAYAPVSVSARGLVHTCAHNIRAFMLVLAVLCHLGDRGRRARAEIETIKETAA